LSKSPQKDAIRIVPVSYLKTGTEGFKRNLAGELPIFTKKTSHRAIIMQWSQDIIASSESIFCRDSKLSLKQSQTAHFLAFLFVVA
jgi:hypothetical protein